jgi:hypothetical protein
MKARKAIKKLSKVADLLTDVLDEYTAGEAPIRNFLDAAKSSVAQARAAIDAEAAPDAAENGAPPDAKPKSSRLSAEGRKRISVAAKKRWAEARRKAANGAGKRVAKAAG